MKKIYLMLFILGTGFLPARTALGQASPDDNSAFGSGATQCNFSNSGGEFTDGVPCNADNGEIAAVDIRIPEGMDLTLHDISINMMLEEGATVSSATIWILNDAAGYPASENEVSAQTLSPSSHILLGSASGQDFYEVSFNLSPVVMAGALDYDVRYWVGVSATTSDGSNPLWEIADFNLGRAVAYSPGSSFDIYDWTMDGVYEFNATCEPMGSGGGGEDCSVFNLDNTVWGVAPCNEEYGYVAANDVLVPAGLDMTLTGMLVGMVYEGSGEIASGTVMLFEDDGEKPLGSAADAIASRSVVPVAQNLMNTNFGDGVYEVEWEFDPIQLPGKLNEDVRYWIGLSVTSDDGFTSFGWVTSEYTLQGAPPFASYGGQFEIYDSDSDGIYIFHAYCNPTQDEDGNDGCGVELPRDQNPQGDGYNCHATNFAVANDLVVPANSDMFLTAVAPSLIMEAGITVDYAAISVYADNNGLPGEEMYYELLLPTSHTHQNTYGDLEAHEVLFDFGTMYLPGKVDVETTYWVGVSAYLSSGSNVSMEVASETSVGHPVAIRSGGAFLIPNAAHDGVWSFTAECEEISGPTDPIEGYCGASNVEVDQSVDQTCFGSVNQGGMIQSFVAEQVESSGAAFKFTLPSRGLEVTISLWDGMPEEGNMLASRTTETYGDQWVEVFWESEVMLEVGQEYFLFVQGDDELSCLRAANDIYPDGQAYAAFQAYSGYDYTFRTYFCYDVECAQEVLAAAFPNSILTSKDQPQTAATDITVPIAHDFLLRQIAVYLWVMPGITIDHADIVLYGDNGGVPGMEMESFDALVPTSQTYMAQRYGYDVLEVVFDIPEQLLTGKFDNITSYWVSFDVQTAVGSALINTTSTSIRGHYAALSSDGAGSWEMVDGWDISSVFRGDCLPIAGNACEQPELEVNQQIDVDCIGAADGGVAQSFTATTYQLSGAAAKFYAPSMGYGVTLSVWDGLPNSNGNVLASKTTQTTGDAWVEVLWDHVVSVEPGQTYYLVVEGDAGMPCVAGITDDVYEGGHCFAGAEFTPFPDWDYTFKVYGCDGGEPAGDCAEEIPEDLLFETGGRTALHSEYFVANDLTVFTDENFTLTEITASMVANEAIFKVDVYYFDDNGGSPGQEIGAQLSVPVASQSIVGERSGMDVVQINLAVEPFLFEGHPESETTYWIGLRVDDLNHVEDVFWVLTTAQNQGYEAMQQFQGGAWAPALAGADGIYAWTGDCSSIPVGTDNRELTGFRFHPNPADHTLNLTGTSTIHQVTFFDMLGRKVLAEEVNGHFTALDIAGLTPGVYLMQVRMGDQSGTYRFVKQ